jgi:hypothetical protein
VNPHFYQLRKEAVGKDQVVLGNATERCERDFLSPVLCVTNSNEIRERNPDAAVCTVHAMMNAILERKGFDVVAAASVIEALRRLQHDGSAFG